MAGFWLKAVRRILGQIPDVLPTTREAERPRGAASYPVGIVGEKNYQPAIRRCREGEAVSLIREPSNPYDSRAIAAVCARGRTLGYIANDSFLHRAVWKEKKGCTAQIRSIALRNGGLLGVVLDVQFCAGPLDERAFAGD